MKTNKQLPDAVITALENMNVAVSDVEEHDGEYCCEIEFYSDFGEDVIETMWFSSLSNKDIVKEFVELADNFEPEEHAAMWYDNRHGDETIPQSLADLLKDAFGIQKRLREIAEKVKEVLDPDAAKMKTFHVSVAVDGRLPITVKAESFDEAREKAENLDGQYDWNDVEIVSRLKAVNATDEDDTFIDY